LIAVSIEDLWVKLGRRTVLEAINLEVEERDFIGLIGPNGGGKSTLLRAMLGLIQPTQGKITVFGRKPAASRRSVGYLPQRNLFDSGFPATALDVVLMGRYGGLGLMKRAGPADREAANDALTMVDMAEKASREIGALSGGEQQRVFLARALVSRPRLLLLDEPITGIDASQQGEIYDLFHRLNREMAIIMVSHDLSAISTHVEKIACLSRRLYYHGSKELSAEDLIYAYGCPVDMIAHGVPHRVLREHV